MIRKFLKDFFSFTRSERNGILILLVLIIILVCARIYIPYIRKTISYDFSEFQDEIQEFEQSLSAVEDSAENKLSPGKDFQLFTFDPNNATASELEKLGLSSVIVRNLLRYRERGGTFRKKEDLRKIYGIDSSTYYRLEPYISILPQNKTSPVQSKEKATANERFLPVPLNLSDSADLIRIQGIGPVLATRIIRYRDLLGGFVSKEQLMEVYGISPERFAEISRYIYIDTINIRFLYLNETDEYTLSRHPYLNEYQAKALMAYRDIKGKFTVADEILRNNLLPEDVFDKIEPYLRIK